MKNFLYEDKQFLLLVAFTFCLIVFALLWNHTHQHYTVDLQWINPFIFSAAGMFAMYYFLGILTTHRLPYLSNILKSIGMVCFSWLLLPILNTTAFTTPFSSLYNQFFNHLDYDMGFHLIAILKWMQHHPTLQFIAIKMYVDILFTAFALPIALAIAKQQNAVYHYYASFMLILIFSFTFYYFFPTTSPASIYPAHYFSATQIHLSNYFQAEHTDQPFHFKMSSIIGFPSLHAAWTVLFIYFLWQYRLLKYPALIVGVMTLCAIIPTGWHFLSDIISGIVVALLSIILGYYFLGTQGKKASLTRNGSAEHR